MNVRKMIDTNILAFALINDHPASEIFERILRNPKIEWHTTSVTIFELFHVLTKVYGLSEEEVQRKIHEIVEGPLHLDDVDPVKVIATIDRIVKQRMDVNDAYILETTLREGIGVIVTDNKKLQQMALDEGLAVEKPITAKIRQEMVEWEEKMIPEKGLPRMLQRIHSWLKQNNPETAEKFREQTRYFKKLP